MALNLPKLTLPWLSNTRTDGRLAIALGPEGTALALCNAIGELQFCQFFPPSDNPGKWLAERVEQYGWQKLPCSVVLHTDSYQLLQAERPPVEGDELSAAVRWKVREFLDFPVEEAAIQHFALPEDAYYGRQPMVCVAALPRAELEALIEPIENSGLAVDCVEITELALHYLITRVPAEGGGIALLHLHNSGGFINLVADGQIYLTRRLDIGLDRYRPGDHDSNFLDMLALEIQRSLDFFESQMGKGIITRLFYSPALGAYAGVGEIFHDQLGLEVYGLSPATWPDITLAMDDGDSDELCRCAAAIGAALGPAEHNGLESIETELDRAAS